MSEKIYDCCLEFLYVLKALSIKVWVTVVWSNKPQILKLHGRCREKVEQTAQTYTSAVQCDKLLTSDI